MARLLSPLGYPMTEASVLELWDLWERRGDFALVVDAGAALEGVVTLHTMIVLHRPKPVGRITSLAVDPGARGRGWGRALMSAAGDALRAEGCGLIEVTSHRRRAEAHAFYEHLGYERTSHRFAHDLDPA